MYRILSLDGGGIRGLITAGILQRLCADPAVSGWLENIDLFAGTSTGGILALALAAQKSPQEIYDLYKENGKAIFDDSIWDNICDLGKVVGADYSNKNLKTELKRIFGAKTLGQLKKKVAIPTFDLDNESPDKNQRSWKPKIFHNFKGKGSDHNIQAANVALYTSAAPTYFPSVDGYIDGGVFANNPSMIAIAQAISQSNVEAERVDISEIVLLSIGTGANHRFIKGDTIDWGFAQWIKPLLEILMDGVTGISDYQAKQLLGDRYRRIQVVFDSHECIPLDAVNKINQLEEIVAAYNISGDVDWISAHWH